MLIRKSGPEFIIKGENLYNLPLSSTLLLFSYLAEMIHSLKANVLIIILISFYIFLCLI